MHAPIEMSSLDTGFLHWPVSPSTPASGKAARIGNSTGLSTWPLLLNSPAISSIKSAALAQKRWGTAADTVGASSCHLSLLGRRWPCCTVEQL